MGDSRLERGLRAAAWTALVATLLALIGLGVFLQPPAAANETPEKNAAAATAPAADNLEENE